MLVPIDQLGLTQIYLNQEKVEKNRQLLQQEGYKNYLPIAVYEIFPGKLHIIDGHTRSFLLQQAGVKEIEVAFLPAAEIENPVMRPFYETCVKWCAKAGVETIDDLARKIIPADEFLIAWITRCQQKIDLIESCVADPLLNKQCQLIELSGVEALAFDQKGQVITEGRL